MSEPITETPLVKNDESAMPENAAEAENKELVSKVSTDASKVKSMQLFQLTGLKNSLLGIMSILKDKTVRLFQWGVNCGSSRQKHAPDDCEKCREEGTENDSAEVCFTGKTI